MGAPITDDEFSKYAPKQFREQPRMPAAQQLHVTPTVRSSADMHQERRSTDEIDSWPERIPEPPPPRSDARTSSLFVRFSPAFIFAAVLALGILFYKPVLQVVGGLFEASQPPKPSDRPAADAAPLNGRGDRLATNAPPAAASVARPAPALVPQPAPLAQPAHSSPAPAAAPPSPPANTLAQAASAPQPLQHESRS